MMPPYKDTITSSPDLTISSWDALWFMNIIACFLIRISFRILKSGGSIPNIGEVVSQPEIAWTNGIIWHASSLSVDVVLHIFIVVELVLIDWNRHRLNRDQSRKAKVLTNQYLAIKNRRIVDCTFNCTIWGMYCWTFLFDYFIVLKLLITFCLYFESARNSPFYDLKMYIQ